MENLEMARQLWEEFGDVPIDDYDCIECDWRSFPKGTYRFNIWKWFEEFFDVSIALDLCGWTLLQKRDETEVFLIKEE